MKMSKKIGMSICTLALAVGLVACNSNQKKESNENSNQKVEQKMASESFPKFKGKDFDGEDVDDSIFSKNKVTVLNFWFNGCSACVNEMPELEKLNNILKEKGSEIIGVNVLANQDENEMKEAKEILKKQGANYRNMTMDEGKEAIEYINNMMAFPTTVLVDQKGNIIGKPIVGSIDNEKAQKYILDIVSQYSIGENNIEDKVDPGIVKEQQSGVDQNEEMVKLNNEINKIFDENKELWSKILANAPKENIENMDQEFSYGDYLKKALENAKNSITKEEMEIAQKDIKLIDELDKKINELQSKN